MVEKTEYHHEQTVNKQANITCAAAKDVDGKEERIIRNQRKDETVKTLGTYFKNKDPNQILDLKLQSDVKRPLDEINGRSHIINEKELMNPKTQKQKLYNEKIRDGRI